MPGKFAAVILAAGQSRRMGSPKMLLPWGSSTVLEQVVSVYVQAGAEEIMVVTGGARLAVEAEAERLAKTYPVRTIYNEQFESGEMTSSLQCGLKQAGDFLDAVLVGLGDQPQISLDAVQKVVAAYRSGIAHLVVPSCNHRRGHPWLVQRVLWQELIDLPSGATLRSFLNEHSSEIQYVETDGTVLKDLDTPEDYQREKP